MYLHLSCLICQSGDAPVLNMLEHLVLTYVQITGAVCPLLAQQVIAATTGEKTIR